MFGSSLKLFQPENCQIVRTGPKLVNASDARVDELKGIGLRRVFGQFHCPTVQITHFTRLSFVVRSFASIILKIIKILLKLLK